MKNIIDLFVMIIAHMGLFINMRGRPDNWKQIEGCHVICHSCDSHFYA